MSKIAIYLFHGQNLIYMEIFDDPVTIFIYYYCEK